MNRRITLVGVGLFLAAVALMVSPIAIYGYLVVDLEFQLGVLLLAAASSVVLVGLAASDPRVTTIGGVFGNPDENEMRRSERRSTADDRRRYALSPKEPTNCRQCYTVIAWDVADCPRCSKRRECRECGRPLFYLAGGVRCTPCARDEVYCNCPRSKARPGSALGARRRYT